MKEVDNDRLPGDLKLGMEIRRYASNLYGALRADGDSPVTAVYFRRRPGGLWSVVVKRTEAGSGQAQVCFGTAGSFEAGIIEASKEIARGKWKEDKPWGVAVGKPRNPA